jgi:hypothetical protein
MAVIGASALTYADWAKRVDDSGKIAAIVELLSMTNEVMEDMLVLEGNSVTGHKTTVRTGLPTSTWRLLNYGVALSKSTTAQIVDTPGNLETESQVDVDIARLNGNTPEFRMSESKAFFQSMSEEMASTIFYGNTAVNPERFMGLSPRYNTVTTTSAQTAFNVLDAGGTEADNTSIWIVTWGSDTTHGFFPKASRAGLSHQDKGEWRVLDGTGNPYWAFVDHYKWELGLSVRDWRMNIRIANIDVSSLIENATAAADLEILLIRALNRLPVAPSNASSVQTSDVPSIRDSMGRTVIYMNRTVKTYLEVQAIRDGGRNTLLQTSTFGGRPITSFRGVTIRTVDALLNTESRVT